MDRDAGRADGGGLAVAATSAAAVLERRAEIGIMKAIGATNTSISALFLAEHLMLALIGGAIGFVFGTVLRVFSEKVSSVRRHRHELSFCRLFWGLRRSWRWLAV